MCDTFNIYSRRTNKLEGVKECAVVSTTELAELRSENRRLKHRIELLLSELGQLRDEANAFWRNEEEPANANH